VIRQSEFSLRKVTLSSLVWYSCVLAGWTLLAVAVAKVITTSSVQLVAPLLMTAFLLVVLELLPLIQGRGHDPQGVVMSTAFTCAMLFVWGVWPAIIMIAVASTASDLRGRKNWWKVLFNPAQYTLSVGAAYLVMLVGGNPVSLAHPLTRFNLDDMVWIVGVWIVYFTVNLALVAGVLTWTGSFRNVVADDFVHYTAMTFSVLALSPVIVVAALHEWSLLPLLLVPLLLLYYTAQMSLEREHAAGHDALTGLPNRTSFHFELDAAFVKFRRDELPFGLMLIDLDDFKRVNDTLGHQVGDDLLVHFARRLNDAIRPSDKVARLGGDEFAVIVFDADEADVRGVAERVRDSIIEPIELRGLFLEVDLSIGLAVCPAHATDGTELLQRADVAMYIAKDNRTGIEAYSPIRDRNSADRLGLLGELRQALDDDVLVLHYQPKVSTRDSVPLGVEALVRWWQPGRGFIPPDEFIPLAERSGIMPLLTARVVTIALDQMAQWRAQGMDVPIAVNIAPTDLVGNSLTHLVAHSLRHYALPANMLQLEITERIVTHELEEAKQTLRRLREMGVSISLDDFGTGYSSLMRLSSLPVDEIKIDRAFVSCLADGERAVGIVRALIDLAHALGVPAIAEGVETQEEWQVLNGLGCDGVQGWYVAMPMPAAEATEWLLGRLPLSHLQPRSPALVGAKPAVIPAADEPGPSRNQAI